MRIPTTIPNVMRTMLSVVCAGLFAGFNTLPARADLSAPDNLVYGTITFGANPVTASDTDVSVEVRKTNGVLVARYTMGAKPDAGNFYVLSVPVEELPPLQEPSSVLLNEPLTIQATSGTELRAQQSFTVMERGLVTRLDLSAPDTNEQSGFEAWAQANGLDGTSQNLDADGDGASNRSEYVAGTNPKNAASRFVVRITSDQTALQVFFDAVRAEGTGYSGSTRHYALERLADYPNGTWEAVPGFSDIVGANQQVVYSTLTAGVPLFFRAKVSLTIGAP